MEEDYMMSSIFYGEIKEDKLQTWSENRDPYDILVLTFKNYSILLLNKQNPMKRKYMGLQIRH